MGITSDIQDFEEELRAVREALRAGEIDDALEGLLDAREEGLISAGLDAQIDALRGNPVDETIEEAVSWISEQLDDGVSVAPTPEERIAASEPSEADLEFERVPYRQRPDNVGESSSGLADPSGTDRTRASSLGGSGFSRESNSLTAVGHEDLSERAPDELERSERQFEAADAEFERLPSIDFAMIDSGDSSSPAAVPEEEPSEPDPGPRAPSRDLDAPAISDDASERATERNPAVSELDVGDSVPEDPSEAEAEEAEDRGEGRARFASPEAEEESDPFDFAGANTEQEAEYWDSAIHERDEALDEPASEVQTPDSVGAVDSVASDDVPNVSVEDDEFFDEDEELFEEPDPSSGDDGAFDKEELFGEGEELFGDDGSLFEEDEELFEEEQTDRDDAVEMEGHSGTEQPGRNTAPDGLPDEDPESSQPKYAPERTLRSSSSPTTDEHGDEFSESSTQIGVGTSTESDDRQRESNRTEGSVPFAAPGRPAADEPSSEPEPTPKGDAAEFRQMDRRVEESAPEESSDSTSPGTGEPLSEEEFFQLADELSEVSSADNVEPIPEEPAADSQAGEDSNTGSDQPAASDLGEVQDSSSTAEFTASQHDYHETRSPDQEVVDSVRLIREAEDLFAEGKYDSAHDLVQSVLQRDPRSDRAQKLLKKIERERASSETSPIESLDAIPVRALGLEQIEETDLDHRAGFLLSLVDGDLTFEDILDLSSMSRAETLEILSRMVEKSVIAIED